MREFFRRKSEKLDTSLAEAQAKEATARSEYDRAHAKLSESVRLAEEAEARLKDLPNILAQDHADHLEQMRLNREEREARAAKRQQELDELEK